MLQKCAYFSFPITLSILIFLAALNKEKLEKTTGLRILQTGVGEVSGLGAFYTLKNILIVVVFFYEILELMNVCELRV